MLEHNLAKRISYIIIYTPKEWEPGTSPSRNEKLNFFSKLKSFCLSYFFDETMPFVMSKSKKGGGALLLKEFALFN